MKTRIFSRKDGKTLIEHIQDAADWVKAMVNGLPAKVKKLLPEAEDIVAAIESLADALKDGHPINEAVERALALIPGTQDEVYYEAAKELLFKLAERLRLLIDDIKDRIEYEDGGSPELSYSSAKKETAVQMVSLYNEGEPTAVEAGVAIEVTLLATSA